MITTPQSNADEQQEPGRLSLAELNQRFIKEGVAATLRCTHLKNASRLVSLATVCYTLRASNVGESPYCLHRRCLFVGK